MTWRDDWDELRETAEGRAFVEAEEAKHTIARNLFALRGRRGWSQGHLAKAAGMAQSTISKIETADQNVGIETLGKLAAAFEVSVEDLLGTLAPLEAAQDREQFVMAAGAGVSHSAIFVASGFAGFHQTQSLRLEDRSCWSDLEGRSEANGELPQEQLS